MKETKLYTCEFCNTSYAEKDRAKECEKNHKKWTIICGAKYLAFKSDRTGKPQKIQIEFEDGSTEWYQKS